MFSTQDDATAVPATSDLVPIEPPPLLRSWTRFQRAPSDTLPIQETVTKVVFDRYRYHQSTPGAAHPSQVVTREQLSFIMEYYTEIEQFYDAQTAPEPVKYQLVNTPTGRWEREQDQYYTDERDLCDIMC